MAQPPSMDPTALWRNMVSEWEKNLNALGKQTMDTAQFSQAMNQATGVSLAMQQGASDMASRTVTAMNLPTRNDIAVLGERLLAIEDRLDRISAALEALGAKPDAVTSSGPTRPPRTRRPAAAGPGPNQARE